VLKQNTKTLVIVCGALVVLGVALMLLFNNTITGILGRIVALGGALDFALIFVLLRVIVACFVSLKKSK